MSCPYHQPECPHKINIALFVDSKAEQVMMISTRIGCRAMPSALYVGQHEVTFYRSEEELEKDFEKVFNEIKVDSELIYRGEPSYG